MLRLGTHVVSAILNLGQKVDRDWPLHIQDNEGNHHQVCSLVMSMMVMTKEMISIVKASPHSTQPRHHESKGGNMSKN